MIITKGMYDKEFKVEINGKEENIIIKPISASHLKSIIKLARLFVGLIDEKISDDEKNFSFLDALSEGENATILMDVVKATVKKSYPELDDQTIEEFSQVNKFKLIPLIIQVNMQNG